MIPEGWCSASISFVSLCPEGAKETGTGIQSGMKILEKRCSKGKMEHFGALLEHSWCTGSEAVPVFIQIGELTLLQILRRVRIDVQRC